MKTRNLAVDRPASYDACPYCLTEMPPETTNVTDIEPDHPSEVERVETAVSSTIIQPPISSSMTGGKCTRQFGYLSTRTSKEGIPDECVLCEDIVKCMLKRVNE